MKISIIVPTFKPDYYIWECLDSLREQSLNSELFEIIIVLNGVKQPYYNSIKEYIKKYKFMNFKFIYIKKKGVSFARNVALNTLKGEYVLFLDDDDFLDKNYLEEILKTIEKNNKNSIVVTNYLNFYENTRLEKNRTNYKLGIIEKQLWKKRKVFSTIGAKLIPRKLIGDERFDTNLRNGEDAFFMLKISKNIKYILMVENNVFYNRRIRITSANHKRKKRSYIFNNALYLLTKYNSLLKETGYNKGFILLRELAILKGIIYQIFKI